jgi:hypothetical protein
LLAVGPFLSLAQGYHNEQARAETLPATDAGFAHVLIDSPAAAKLIFSPIG